MGRPPSSTSARSVATARAQALASQVAPAFPGADVNWRPDVREAYGVYCAAEVARMLRDEDIELVWRRFALADDLERALDEYRGLRDRVLEAETAIDVRNLSDAASRAVATAKALDGMIARLDAQLGIGARNRMSVGLLAVEGAKAAPTPADEMAADL